MKRLISQDQFFKEINKKRMNQGRYEKTPSMYPVSDGF